MFSAQTGRPPLRQSAPAGTSISAPEFFWALDMVKSRAFSAPKDGAANTPLRPLSPSPSPAPPPPPPPTPTLPTRLALHQPTPIHPTPHRPAPAPKPDVHVHIYGGRIRRCLCNIHRLHSAFARPPTGVGGWGEVASWLVGMAVLLLLGLTLVPRFQPFAWGLLLLLGERVRGTLERPPLTRKQPSDV